MFKSKIDFVVAGFLNSQMGLGTSARTLVNLIQGAKFNCQVLDIHSLHDKLEAPNEQSLSYYDLELGTPIDNLIVVVNGDYDYRSKPELLRIFEKSKKIIGYWVWELEAPPLHFGLSVDLFDEILTPSEFSKKSLLKIPNIDKRITVLPHYISEPHPEPRTYMQKEKEPYFLYSFDFFSDFERKNPLALISAFNNAFPPPEPNGPRLLIKVSNEKFFPYQLKALLNESLKNSKIRIFNSKMSESHFQKLLINSSGLISPHRSEGFGLLMAEAMMCSVPVVATAYGGNMDYMNPGNSILIPYNKVRITENSYQYGKFTDSMWAEPDHDMLADSLRFLVNTNSSVVKLTEVAKIDIERFLDITILAKKIERIKNSKTFFSRFTNC